MRPSLLITALLGVAASFACAAPLKATTTAAATPLFNKMFGEYAKLYGTSVTFDASTSPIARQSILARSVDFAAAIIPQGDTADSDLVQVPVALSAVVLTYNVPGLEERLNFNGRVLSDIYMGRITKWNDPRIRVLNPRVRLPDLAVTPIYRSDASGYSAIFIDYLSKVARDWKGRIRASGVVDWPAGMPVDNEDKSVKLAQALPGSIAYMGLSRALQYRLSFARIQNNAGAFVFPTGKSIEAAGQKAGTDTAGVTYAKVSNAYPISNYIYVLLQREQSYNDRNETQARATRDLVKWMIRDGQQYNSGLYFGELPPEVVAQADQQLAALTFGGKALK